MILRFQPPRVLDYTSLRQDAHFTQSPRPPTLLSCHAQPMAQFVYYGSKSPPHAPVIPHNQQHLHPPLLPVHAGWAASPGPHHAQVSVPAHSLSSVPVHTHSSVPSHAGRKGRGGGTWPPSPTGSASDPPAAPQLLGNTLLTHSWTPPLASLPLPHWPLPVCPHFLEGP